jgi:hypothetical protein
VSREFVNVVELGCGARPGDFVGVFVEMSKSVSEDECDPGEDADEEGDVEAEVELGELEELSDESELDWALV